MIEQWQPAGSSDATRPAAERLKQLLVALQNADSDAPVIQQQVLNAELLADAKSWTQLDESGWQTALETLDAESMWQVAVFYVVAEQQLDDWQMGANNPAIWVFRWLKKNGTPAPKPQIKAIKALTDNRFIPYGSVL